MAPTDKTVLLSMGYHEIGIDGRWVKPFGYQVLTYHESTGRWSNWFMSNGTIKAWETKIYRNNNQFLEWLKQNEHETRVDIVASANTHFELNLYDLG